MTCPGFLLLAFLLNPSVFLASGYTRSYIIFIRGIPSGTEQVIEDSDKEGNLVSSSESEIFISDGIDTKRMAFKSELVLAKGSLAPLRYSNRYTTGRSDGYEVSIKDGRAIRVLSQGGRSSETNVALPPETIIIDFNVYHHFDFLVRRYDVKKGGRQNFRNFLPLIAADVPMVIVRVEDSKVERGGQSIPVQNYKVEITGVWNGSVSCDKDGRLVRLVASDQDLEVLRKDLVPELTETPKEEKKPPLR